MSKEVELKLSEAKDKIDELRSAISDVIDGITSKKRLDNLQNLLNSIGEFVTYNIDGIYSAMDDAVDEIDRLDQENSELNERIGELEQRIAELLPESEE